jgi:hypothetical protein
MVHHVKMNVPIDMYSSALSARLCAIGLLLLAQRRRERREGFVHAETRRRKEESLTPRREGAKG